MSSARPGTRTSCWSLVRWARPDLAIIDIRMPPGARGRGPGGRPRDPRAVPGDRGPGPVGARRGRAGDGAARGPPGHWLPAQEPCDRHDGVRGDRQQDRARRLRGGPGAGPGAPSARRRDDPLEGLTEREREVLALVAEGRSNAGIAHRLWITEGTVEKHVRSILTKPTCPSRTPSTWWCAPASCGSWMPASPRRRRNSC